MADTKVSAFPVASSVTGADIIPIVQGGVTKQATVSLLPTGGGGTDFVMGGYVKPEVLTDATGNYITST
jgi:hypothetical protein